MLPNDPLLLQLTLDQIEQDYWAHHYYDNPSHTSVEDDDFDVDALVDAMAEDDWETVINEQEPGN